MRGLLFALALTAAQAQEDALRGLRFDPLPEGSPSPSPHLNLAPVAGAPGVWRAQGDTKGHGIGTWRVTNTGATRLGLPSQTVTLRWARAAVPARCALVQREPELAPGASAHWACAFDAPLPAEVQGMPRWDWAPPLVVIEALLPPREAASRVRPRPSPRPLREEGAASQPAVGPSPAPPAATARVPNASGGLGLGAILALIGLLGAFGAFAVAALRARRGRRAEVAARPAPPVRSAPASPTFRPAEPIAPTEALRPAGGPASTPLPSAPRWNCPSCRSPFAHLQLPGHYGAELQLDHCDACRLLWFDEGELARLSPQGWTQLLHQLAEHERPGTALPLTAEARCPRCDLRLQTLHDQTLFGRFVGLACPQGHGRAKRDAALFAARGLFRRLHGFEVGRLKAQADCLACGAPRAAQDAGDCRYCGSPPMVIDLQRLAQSLGLQARRSTLGQGKTMLWSCAGCGQALDASTQTECPQCAHPVLAQRLAEVRPLLEAALRRPPPSAQEQVAARQAQVEALIAHERMKADWQRMADRPRSPVMRLLLGAVRLLGRRE